MKSPYFSVVVPTVQRTELLLRCLSAIVEGTFADFEILVVDQSPDDSTRRTLRDRFGGDSRIRYLHSRVTGAARARNLGCLHAKGTILAFVDDDGVPAPGWLAAYARAFQGFDPPPGMVGGRITPIWEKPCPSWYPARCLPLLGLHDAGATMRPFPPGDFPISANFAIPRALFEQIGGFDPSLGFDVGRRNPLLGGEDSLLGLEVANAGRTVLYHPDAAIGHLVRGAKLTPRYFLRRYYWHGRTYLQLRRRPGGDRRPPLQIVRDALNRSEAGRLPGRGEPLAARLALLAAGAAFAAGLAAEAGSLAMGRGEQPARRE